MLRETRSSTPRPDSSRTEAGSYSAGRAAAQFAAVVLILFIYSYPSLKARVDLRATSLPSIFAPDLSLYLNLSILRTVSPGQVLNPYHLVQVPFFCQFKKVIVIYDLRDTTFLPARLGSFLKLEGEQRLGHWVLLSYVPFELK
jgi:hypothetical protein